MTDLITWIYAADDIEPAASENFENSITERYRVFAAPYGLDFRVIRAGELVPACLGRPVLWYRGEDLLSRPQCFIVEDASKDPQAVQALRAIYRTIHASGCVLLNRAIQGPDFLERDKLAILQYATGLGIPTARTIAVPFGRYARRVLDEVERELGPGPYIVKPRDMSMGIGVLRVDSAQQLAAAIDIASQTGSGYIVQPLLENTGDMRVFVADGEVLASMTRRPAPGGYLANISHGASLDATDDHLKVAKSCQRIAQGLTAEWMCIDWLMTSSGPVLNEWCTAYGGFTILPEPARTRVADAFFLWIKKKFGEML
jgi:glutathione synthase/RimK-type ligase-like ATP-grasp enzyme